MDKAQGAREQKSKAEIEALLVAALDRISRGVRRKVEITQADPALYGANWAATGISGVEDRDESTILAAVTVLQGKYDVTW